MKCPVCGREFDRLLALSRRDNRTMICDECGVKESLDDAGLKEGSSVRDAILREMKTVKGGTRHGSGKDSDRE